MVGSHGESTVERGEFAGSDGVYHSDVAVNNRVAECGLIVNDELGERFGWDAMLP